MPKNPLEPAAIRPETATIISPEVKVAVAQVALSEGDIEISEVLRDRRAETIALIARIMKAAGIEVDLPGRQVRKASQVEISTEQLGAYFAEFEPRFNALKAKLGHDVTFEEVKKALRASPEAVRTFIALDAAGFAMNVFKSKNPAEIVFRMAQLDVTKIDPKYRTIMADKQAQLEYPEYNANGNAEEIAAGLGVELADAELYEQLKVENGWVWLKTDAATRKSGLAFDGVYFGVGKRYPKHHYDDGSFCAALRVKKA